MHPGRSAGPRDRGAECTVSETVPFIPGPYFEALAAGAGPGAGAGAGAGVAAGAGAGELLELDEPMPKEEQPVATAATAATENRILAFIRPPNRDRFGLTV